MSLRRLFCTAMLSVLFLIFPNTAIAASDAEVDQWFTQQGKTALISHGSTAFPDMSTGELNGLEIGAHTTVASLSKSQVASVDDLVRGAWQAAIVTSANEPVGVLWADFSADKPASVQVSGDKTLAGHLDDILAGKDEQELIYDELLKAWFLLRNSSVSAGDDMGEEIIAGSVSAEDFLIQRTRNVSGDNAAQIDSSMDEPATVAQGNVRKEISPVFAILVVVVVAALLTVSLLWLRWESQHIPEDEIDGPLKMKAGRRSTAASSLNVTRANSGKEESAPTLSTASGNVRIYSRDKVEE